MAPISVAAVIGAALTGVLAAQTRPAVDTSTTMMAAAVASPVEGGALDTTSREAALTTPDAVSTKDDTAATLFKEGVKAYTDGNIEHAVQKWEAAARDGHITAQWNLARLILSGDWPTSDRARALDYLRNVASMHDADQPPGQLKALAVEALVVLGRLHWEGFPDAELQPAPQRAFRIFKYAATLYGHPRAQHYLGVMYLKGDGVKQHTGRAVRWLFLAASKHYAPSQAALGDYFWQHRDVDNYRERALMWFALASKNAKSDDTKVSYSDRYNAALTEVEPDERAKVAALVDSWNARYLTSAR